MSGEARAGHLLVGILFASYGVESLVSTQRCSPILTVAALFFLLAGTAELLALLPLGGRLSLVFYILIVAAAVAGAGMMLLPPVLAAFAPGPMRLLRPVLWLMALASYGVAFASLGWSRYPWVPAMFMLFGGVVWLVAIVITAVALKDKVFAPTRSIWPQQGEQLIRNRTDERQPRATIIDRGRKP